MTILRSFLFNLFFFGMTFILTMPGTVLRFVAPHRMLSIAVVWARLTVWGARAICGIRLEVIGIPPTGAALIASRHQSAFDTVVWLSLVPRACYVMKQELLRIPLFGKLIPLTGMIAVDRAGGATALRHLLREAERAVRESRQIVIFPEGTRAAPGATLPLQPGVAALAAHTGLPVIPVVTDSGLCWGRRAFRKRPGTVHIVLLPPIQPGQSRQELLRRLQDDLRMDVNAAIGLVDKSVG
jgi:1-acyl-sn-glycerol-3-phosphate acyltransferase